MGETRTIAPADAALLRAIAAQFPDLIANRIHALADWLESPTVSCLCCGSAMRGESPYCGRCAPDRVAQ